MCHIMRTAMLCRRYHLQKAFLNKDKIPPSEEDMSRLSGLLGDLETWQGLTADLIKCTKIHKVLKGIMRVDFEIPLEDEFHFRKRSEGLYKQMMEMIAAETAAAEQGGEGGPKENDTMNGNAGEPKNEAHTTTPGVTGKAEGDQEELVTAVTAGFHSIVLEI